MHFKSIFRHYWQFARGYPFLHFLLFFSYGIAQLGSIIAAPLIYKEIIDTVTNPGTDAFSRLDTLLLALIFFIVFYNIFFRAGDWLMARIQNDILRQLADYTLERLQHHSYNFFTNAFAGSLIAKSRRFVNAFETLHDQLVFQLWMNGISFFASIAVLFYFSPTLGGIFIGWFLCYLVLVYFMVNWQIPKSLASSAADSVTTGHFSDIISNFLTVKMFAAQGREEKEFRKTTASQAAYRYAAWQQQGFWNNMYQAIAIGIFNIVIVWVALDLWKQGEISAGVIVLVQVYVINTFNTVWTLSRNVIKVFTALTDAHEMVEILDTPIDVKDPKKPEKVRISEGRVRFENVDFEYSKGISVFEGLNLDIAPGERVALVGHSGAGKTTIVKLLLRFTDIQEGAITIDGQNIAKITQNDLRRHIAYVPQEPLLFHRSLRDNIAYAKPDASMEEIENVARRAHADSFIKRLPQGYDTLVGERGVKLSGGERQRIAIARAMLKDAPVLVLDEATSSLDSISEEHIQAGFQELMKGKTTIVIAHRLSTIQKMDRIIVFEQGKIVEMGPHQELLAKNGVYAELWNSQVGGFITE